MDAAGVALTLSVVAYKLIQKSLDFRKRTKCQAAVLDNLIDHCRVVQQDADHIEAQIREAEARGAAMEWVVVANRVQEMKTLLHRFDIELGDFIGNTPTTNLGRALLQLKADDAQSRIRDICEGIHIQYRSLTLLLPIALR